MFQIYLKDILEAELRKYSIILSEKDVDVFVNMEGGNCCLWLSMVCQYIVDNYSSMTVSDLQKLPRDRSG